MPNQQPRIEVIRSARRKRSVSARFVNDGLIQVRIPAYMSQAEEAQAVSDVVEKVKKKYSRTVPSDAELTERANKLNAQVLEGRAHFGSIKWVSNQNKRWASCSMLTGDIRVSDRLRGVPDYVLDSVIVHELVHTFVFSGHSPEFWDWANRAPQVERAKGYLDAYQDFAQGRIQ